MSYSFLLANTRYYHLLPKLTTFDKNKQYTLHKLTIYFTLYLHTLYTTNDIYFRYTL